MRIYPLLILIVSGIGCGNKDDADKLRFLERGNLAYANDEIPNAIRFYEEALIKDSTFVDAWNNKGLALMRIARYDDAIYCFDMALVFKPDYKEALLNNTRANLEVHQHYSAMNNLDELAMFWPDSSIIPFTRGLILDEMNKPTMALDEFRRALKLDRQNVEIWINMGNIFYHQNRLDSAILLIQSAIRLDASQPHAYNVLAMIYASQGEYEEGLKAINTALSYKLKDAFFLNNKGFILIRLERFEAAEENIVASMKIDPYNAWVYRNLGLLRAEKGDFVEAVRLLEKALKMDDTVDNIYADLAGIYVKLDMHEKACILLLSAPADEEISSLVREHCL